MKIQFELLPAVQALTANLVRGAAMQSDAIQGERTELGKTVESSEADSQIPGITLRPQLTLDFCPSQKKHFFCGVARQLGCRFCAKPEPRQESPSVRL